MTTQEQLDQIKSTVTQLEADLAIANADVLRITNANTDLLRDQDFMRSKLTILRQAFEAMGGTWPEGLWGDRA